MTDNFAGVPLPGSPYETMSHSLAWARECRGKWEYNAAAYPTPATRDFALRQVKLFDGIIERVEIWLADHPQ